MKARTAMARPAEMSSWAASAAHDSMKAAPMMARPKISARTASAASGWCTRENARPGTVIATARPM